MESEIIQWKTNSPLANYVLWDKLNKVLNLCFLLKN